MNEVIDQLRELATSTAAYMDLPSEDDLVLVEEEILLPIPRDLRNYLLEASDVLYGSLEPVTVADPGAHTHLPEVTSNAWAVGVPRDLMVICQSGEDYYCVNQEGEVVFWQDGEVGEENWEDIWQWMEEVWLNS